MVDNSRTYFACRYRLDNVDGYIIWYRQDARDLGNGRFEDQDGVFIDESGHVPVFPTLKAVQAYASGLGFDLQDEEPILHNLDVIERWLQHVSTDEIDCAEILAAWNLFGDVSRSIGAQFDPDISITLHVYNKLFLGNNLPAMTPQGKHYAPFWDHEEAALIADIQGIGLGIFRDVIVKHDSPTP